MENHAKKDLLKLVEDTYKKVQRFINSLKESNYEEGHIFYKLEDEFKQFETANEYWYGYLNKVVNTGEIPEDINVEYIDLDRISMFYRSTYIQIMGFCVVTKKLARSLNETVIKNKRCLEVMCGTGALSKALQDEGIDVIATDNIKDRIKYSLQTEYTKIEQIDCLDAIIKYGKDVDFIIMSWIPCDDEIGYEMVNLLSEINPDCKIISINEDEDGCCATDSFFDNIEVLESYDNINQNRFNYYNEFETLGYCTWVGIHDYISVVKPNLVK